MVERNEKGRQIRRYFIEFEKQPRQKEMPTNPPAEAEEKLTLSITRLELCSLCWVWAAGEYYALNNVRDLPGAGSDKILASPNILINGV